MSCFSQLLSKEYGKNSEGSEVNSKSKTSRTKDFSLLKEVEEHDVRSMIKKKKEKTKQTRKLMREVLQRFDKATDFISSVVLANCFSS